MLKQILIKSFASFLLVALFLSCSKNNDRSLNSFTVGDNNLLWKITSDSMSRSAYLFGTIHGICPEDLFMDSAFVGNCATH